MFGNKGEFEPIKPEAGDCFDDSVHKRDNLGYDITSPVGKTILATLMVGVRFKSPGEEWMVCSKADVQLVHSAYQ